MLYKELAELYQSLETSPQRLKKTYILAKFLQKLPNEQIEPTILLLQGLVFPEWESKKIGIAGKLVAKAIANSMGHSDLDVLKLFKKTGDLGEVAFQLCQTKRQQTLFSKNLTLKEVFSTLQNLASHEGIGSQDVKLSHIHKLLGTATPLEAKFIVRTILEDLRIGISIGTLKDAIAYAYFTDELNYDDKTNNLTHNLKSNIDITFPEDVPKINYIKELVKKSMDFTADINKVIQHIKQNKSLQKITLELGTPCKVMLARKEKSLNEAFQRTGLPCQAEYKYDGFRVQIHKNGKKILLFTRRLEEVTKQFPGVVKTIQEYIHSDKCILDAELVGFEPQTGNYLPFQKISQLIRRKYNIEQMSKDFPVECNVFDILLNENDLLIDRPFSERTKILHEVIIAEPKKIVFAKGKLIKTEEEAQKFYEESLKAGNEGIMIKDLQGKYTPGGRVTAWIKFKPIMEELDLVIVGAEWGEGKRSNWLTSFTLACQNEDGELLEIGKVGTGFKEKGEEGVSFEELTNLLEPLLISEKGKEIKVKPQIVLEIQYEEIQKSTSYSSGFALRFPRVSRLRPDRYVEDISSIEDVKELYYEQ